MRNQNIGLKFPLEYKTHKYALIHFEFFVQYAKIAGINVELVQSNDQVFIAENQLIFSCMVNDKQIIVDYADHSSKIWKDLYPNLPYFKFQTTQDNSKGVVPLGPPMIGVKRKGTKGATFREYNRVRYHYDYQPGSGILCKQLPNGAAVERRNHVHALLDQNFDQVDTAADQDQIGFWKQHENCLTAVCVPGATNNMVDRGHLELFGLGVCTISPELYTVFPQNQTLVAGEHYIKCQDDYSDLVDVIHSLQQTPSFAKAIGNHARKFYESYYAPEKYWQWIMENIK
jgi:hypothetical protein